jgi:uncharacterized protein (TIGR03083 family)
LSGYADDTPGQLGPLLVEGAELLAAALLETGADTPMWTPTPHGVAGFFARRFAHETAMHRADAELALGLDFTLAPELAADGIEEWLELGSLPFHFDIHPWMRELLGPGRTIGLVAPDAAWVVDLTGDAITWRRGSEDTAVALHGSLTELLLVIYKRLPPVVRVTGDRDLVDFWLERVGFG